MISDDLYEKLEIVARENGLNNIEELIKKLIDVWQSEIDELSYRRENVKRIDNLRELIFARYGIMSDSVELICADRGR